MAQNNTLGVRVTFFQSRGRLTRADSVETVIDVFLFR